MTELIFCDNIFDSVESYKLLCDLQDIRVKNWLEQTGTVSVSSRIMHSDLGSLFKQQRSFFNPLLHLL